MEQTESDQKGGRRRIMVERRVRESKGLDKEHVQMTHGHG